MKPNQALSLACALTFGLALGLALFSAPARSADLYQEGQFRSLVADVKARRAGDNLTVLVMETSSAAASADTNTKRRTDAGITGTVDMFGPRRSGDISGQVNNDFSGGARTQRAGRLLAQLTVTVIAVEPNGDLRVAGEQALEVNNEQQMIRLEGKVRPQDIGENNAVVSSRIADARITYVGEGALAEGQRVSLVTRILTWLGL
jgi:flagellar L-ring protein precursor FlgH